MQNYTTVSELFCIQNRIYCINSELLLSLHPKMESMNMSKGKDNQCFITTVTHGETLKKIGMNEMWVCRVMEGEAMVSFNMREYKVRKGDAFVVMEGEMFLVVSSSEEMAMEMMARHSVRPMTLPWSTLSSDQRTCHERSLSPARTMERIST